MDRPLHQHHLPADPFAKPKRDLLRAEADPWGLAEAPDAAAGAKPADESVGIGPDVSLAEITRSNVAVNVLEAVAIVREICWMSNDPPAVMFDLETVSLRASGDVVGRPVATSYPPAAVQSVAKVLQALTSRTLVPPKLQEIVAAATTDGERFRSFAELANALQLYQSPNGRDLIRGVYLRWRNGATSSSSRLMGPAISRRLAIVRGVWAKVQSRVPRDRRVVAGLGLFVVACALLIALSRYNFTGSSETAETPPNAAVERLASAFSGALNWIGLRPAAPVASESVASVSKKTVSKVRPTAGRAVPKNSPRALPLMPLISTAEIQPSAPGSIGNADVDASIKTRSEEPADEASLETSIIYSPTDSDVSPPVALRSPGIATDRNSRDRPVSYIEILVSETGGVESVVVLPMPGTIGQALQSNLALSAVKTWRFRPARKGGQPVKYRTTVLFVETVNGGGRD